MAQPRSGSGILVSMLGSLAFRYWRRVILAVTAIVIVAFIIGASDAVQACLNKQAHENPNKRPDEGLSAFGFSIVSAHCVWFFVKDNSEPIIALATIALFIATFSLWKATTDMVKRADVNTASQLVVMTGQLSAMQQQGDWLKDSAGTANQTLEQMRREFAVANRPKVRLRRIYFAGGSDPLPMKRTPDGSGGYTETPTPDESPPRVIIEMAHVGGVGVAKASLRVTFGIFNTGQPEPGRIQDELAKAIPQKMEVSHAGSGVLIVEVPAVGALFYDKGVLSGSQSVYCVGYTEYTDETGTLMGRTGFIRRCDIPNRWFERENFPDFEYAD